MMEQNGKVQGAATEVWSLDAKAKERVQAFLAQKKRVKHYRVKGRLADGSDYCKCDTLSFTDEEVNRIKQLMSDAYVQYMNLPAGYYSMEQIQEEIGLRELQGQIDELDDLLFNPCEEDFFMFLEKIQLDNPIYYYQMSCHIFNEAKRKMEAPIPFRMILTDEEYVQLLTLQLMYRKELSFNYLFKMNKQLACKVNDWAACVFWKHQSLMYCPYVVTLDEIREDAFCVDGPEPMQQSLSEDDSIDFSTYVTAFMERRMVRVEKEIMDNRVYELSVYRLEDISADELTARLGATDYEEMMKKLKSRFRGKSAYEKFRAFLDTEKIAYSAIE